MTAMAEAPGLLFGGIIIGVILGRLAQFWVEGTGKPRTGPGADCPSVVRLPNPKDSKRQQRRDAEDVDRFEAHQRGETTP